MGLTLCAKNLVGVVTNKNTVPHFRVGIDQLAPWVPRWYRVFALTEMLMYKTFLGRRTWWGDLLYKMFFGFWFKDLLQTSLEVDGIRIPALTEEEGGHLLVRKGKSQGPGPGTGGTGKPRVGTKTQIRGSSGK